MVYLFCICRSVRWRWIMMFPKRWNSIWVFPYIPYVSGTPLADFRFQILLYKLKAILTLESCPNKAKCNLRTLQVWDLPAHYWGDLPWNEPGQFLVGGNSCVAGFDGWGWLGCVQPPLAGHQGLCWSMGCRVNLVPAWAECAHTATSSDTVYISWPGWHSITLYTAHLGRCEWPQMGLEKETWDTQLSLVPKNYQNLQYI